MIENYYIAQIGNGLHAWIVNNNGRQMLKFVPIFKERSAKSVILKSTFLEVIFFKKKHNVSSVFMSKTFLAYIACFRIVLINGTSEKVLT